MKLCVFAVHVRSSYASRTYNAAPPSICAVHAWACACAQACTHGMHTLSRHTTHHRNAVQGSPAAAVHACVHACMAAFIHTCKHAQCSAHNPPQGRVVQGSPAAAVHARTLPHTHPLVSHPRNRTRGCRTGSTRGILCERVSEGGRECVRGRDSVALCVLCLRVTGRAP